MARLAGKRAVVTGAASGIGRASALIFAAEGAQVVVVDRNENGLTETFDLIEKEGGTEIAVTADVSDENAVQGFIGTCVDQWGGIDIVYANAGILENVRSLFDLTPENWRKVLDVNLLGPFLALKHSAPVMMDQGGGSIIFTASVAGLRANAGPTAYSASKAGVISLVQTAAGELSGSGVRVNAICPGLIETGMTKPLFDGARAKGSEDRIGQLNPLARPGHPAEIAHMALFLASDEASYVNGQSIPVDGGLSSTHPFIYK